MITKLHVKAMAVALVLMMVIGLAGTAGLFSQVEVSPANGFMPGQILVGFRAGTRALDVDSAHALNDGEVLQDMDEIDVQVVRVRAGDELRAVGAR